MEGLEIEMTSEQVDLSLLLVNNVLHMDIDVTFSFKNYANKDIEMGVCYPIGLKNNVVSFHTETDGVVHDAQIKSYTEHYGRVQLKAWFYDWTATFPAGETVMHKVKYRLNLSAAMRSGYTVSSGGPWKGKIAKSVITLSGTKEAWSRVRGFGPLAGAEQSGDRILWRYSDYDPAPEHDIWLNYDSRSLDATCDAVRGDGKVWGSRCKVVAMRSTGYYAAGKLELGKPEQRALRAALIDLIAEAKEEDGCLVLPASEMRMYTPPPE